MLHKGIFRKFFYFYDLESPADVSNLFFMVIEKYKYPSVKRVCSYNRPRFSNIEALVSEVEKDAFSHHDNVR